MKSIIKCLVIATLLMLITSCESNEISRSSFEGTWEYIIEISFEGTNYDVDRTISETKKFTGTFTWDSDLKAYMNGDIENSYLDGTITDGRLGFFADSFNWSEKGKKYTASCNWKSVETTNNLKEFTTKSQKHSWVEVKYPDGYEIFCTNVNATFKAKKIR